MVWTLNFRVSLHEQAHIIVFNPPPFFPALVAFTPLLSVMGVLSQFSWDLAGLLSNMTHQPDWVSAVAGAGEGLETFVTGCYDGCLRVYGPGCKVSGVFPLQYFPYFTTLHNCSSMTFAQRGKHLPDIIPGVVLPETPLYTAQSVGPQFAE